MTHLALVSDADRPVRGAACARLSGSGSRGPGPRSRPSSCQHGGEGCRGPREAPAVPAPPPAGVLPIRRRSSGGVTGSGVDAVRVGDSLDQINDHGTRPSDDATVVRTRAWSGGDAGDQQRAKGPGQLCELRITGSALEAHRAKSAPHRRSCRRKIARLPAQTGALPTPTRPCPSLVMKGSPVRVRASALRICRDFPRRH